MRTSIRTKKRRPVADRFRQATSKAYREAIEAGITVAVVQDGVLWHVKKNGDKVIRKKIKDMPAPVSVPRGKKIKIAP